MGQGSGKDGRGDMAAVHPEVKAYHHGQLRAGLLAAAFDMVRRDGLDRFSLRAVAKRVGVSQAAPAHHFGSARGLLTELAVMGYGILRQRLQAVDATLGGRARLRALAGAYVGFAIDEPGIYQLMFRRDLIDRDNARYKTASFDAIGVLGSALAEETGMAVAPDAGLAALAPFLDVFSMLHGLAMLAIEAKFDGLLTEEDRADFSGRVVPVILNARWPMPEGG
ncbi:MAG: TetR/AcrR family transcriptional regulator [Pseudomonadota bacterium]